MVDLSVVFCAIILQYFYRFTYVRHGATAILTCGQSTSRLAMFGVVPSNQSMEINYVNSSLSLIGRNFDTVTVGAPIYSDSAIKWNVMGVAVLIAGTTCGNLLVCVAVCRERSLHSMANYFLMSLAIADLLVSVFVMPVGMTILLFGKTVFYTSM